MKSFLLRSTCMVGLLIGAQPAFAQSSGARAEGAAPSAAGLEEIVVTAQRREENLQKAAIAVSAVTGDTLMAAGVTRPSELTSLVPSLQVSAAAGPYNLFYLRGVGNFNANAFSDSAIAFNVDGVYVGRPSSAAGFFYDLERLEVLKGPQGTLYGRNATGGAINVISKKPDFGKLGMEASAEYGNYNQFRIDGVVNVPLGDKAALRVAAMNVSHDGYMNDGTSDQKDWGGRVSLRLEPSEALHINVVADYFKQGGTGLGATPLLAPNGVPVASTFNVDDRIGYFSPAGQAFYTSQRAGTLGRNFSAFPNGFAQFQDNKWWGISATIDWRSELGTLTIVPAYREGNLDYLSFTPGFQVRQAEKSNQTSIEARFATSEDKPLRALVGGYYFKENTNDPVEAYASNWNGQFDSNMRLSTESKALFGRLTYSVTPEIRFTVGARQTWEDKTFSGQRISLTRLCGLPPIQNCPAAPVIPFGTSPAALTGPGQVIVPAFGASPYGGFPDVVNSPALVQTAVLINQAEQGKFNKFTWRAGAEWDLTDQNLLYASYETGFKAGGFYFSPVVGQYKPEAIEAYTIGSKNRFLDNRIQINLELFHWRYSNQQISHLVTIATVPTFATENVGKATFTGFEIETKFAVTDKTTLTADLQYLHAKYDEFIYTQTNQNGGFFNGTGCPSLSVTATAYVVNCSGKRPANAPEWTFNFSAQQRIPVSFGEFVLDARAHYQSETMIGLEFLPVEFNKGYWLADAALTFFAPERRYFIGAFINNMFNETVKAQTFPTPGTNIFSTSLRPPRTYGLRAGIKF